MTSSDADPKVRFLLGLLSDEEREGLEREALAGGEAYEQLLAAEDELFHDYARGALSDEEKARFEERFLRSEAGRHRLQRVRDVTAALGVPSPPRRSSSLLWLAAAALLAIASALALRWTANRSPGIAVATPPPVASPNATLTPAPLPVPPTAILAVTLRPGMVRGEAETTRVRLVPRVTAVRLTLMLPKALDHARYSAALQASDGRIVHRVDGLPPQPATGGTTVIVELPVSLLAEDDYELTLAAGREAVADYTFGVEVPGSRP